MAHSLSLLMKDIAHSKDPALAFVSNTYEQAKSIVKYIRNHGAALFIFRSFSHLEVIQVKKTRFGSHYVVLDRVIRVKNALVNMVLNEEWEKIKKGRSNIEHDVVKKTILDDDFWNRAKLVLSFTKPIWLMIRFYDSDKAVIGQVYQRMEDMLDYVRVSLAGNLDILHVIESIIMKRWEKMNYPLHSLAYVLTPCYYSKNLLRSLSPRGELRKKSHADNYIDVAYLNAVDRLISDRKEQTITRDQRSDFFANKGSFGRPQAIDDRETMDALAWWDMYGATSPDLCSLALKVLSQSVNTSCAERAWSTYSYIHSVKRNRLNADRAESLVFVHYNHKLLSRYRQDYEEAYKNWDTYANDDNLENNIEATEEREYNVLLAEDPRPSQASSTVSLASKDTPESSAAPAKRPRIEE